MGVGGHSEGDDFAFFSFADGFSAQGCAPVVRGFMGGSRGRSPFGTG